MLKEVGASGQISLGKRYAGRLFEVSIEPDDSIVMRPVKVVPASAVVQPAATALSSDASRATEAVAVWAAESAAEIDRYNAWAQQREPYSQRVRRWREGEK